jgi:hypothetical protein
MLIGRPKTVTWFALRKLRLTIRIDNGIWRTKRNDDTCPANRLRLRRS